MMMCSRLVLCAKERVAKHPPHSSKQKVLHARGQFMDEERVLIRISNIDVAIRAADVYRSSLTILTVYYRRNLHLNLLLMHIMAFVSVSASILQYMAPITDTLCIVAVRLNIPGLILHEVRETSELSNVDR